MADLARSPPLVPITVDGTAISVPAGMSLAAALAAVGRRVLRRSPRAGLPRGAFCFMGVCQECVVLVDGRADRACMTEVRPGLSVTLRGPDRA
jgi:predicted molibdopterin-dependent oxidoreductase YjgC